MVGDFIVEGGVVDEVCLVVVGGSIDLVEGVIVFVGWIWFGFDVLVFLVCRGFILEKVWCCIVFFCFKKFGILLFIVIGVLIFMVLLCLCFFLFFSFFMLVKVFLIVDFGDDIFVGFVFVLVLCGLVKLDDLFGLDFDWDFDWDGLGFGDEIDWVFCGDGLRVGDDICWDFVWEGLGLVDFIGVIGWDKGDFGGGGLEVIKNNKYCKL